MADMADTPTQYPTNAVTGRMLQDDGVDESYGHTTVEDGSDVADDEGEIVAVVVIEGDGTPPAPTDVDPGSVFGDAAGPSASGEVTEDDLTPPLIVSDHAAPSPAYADEPAAPEPSTAAPATSTAPDTVASTADSPEAPGSASGSSSGKPSFGEWIAKAGDDLEHGHAGFDNTNPDQSGYDRLTGQGLGSDGEIGLNTEDPDQTHYNPITGTTTGLGE